MDSREKVSAFIGWALEQEVSPELEGIAAFARPLIPALLQMVLEDDPAQLDGWLLKVASVAIRLRSDDAKATALYELVEAAADHGGDNGDVWAVVQ